MIIIENDVYGIVERVKEIDDSYYIVFNLPEKRYELHSSEQGRSTFCLAFPYEELDERVVWHTLRTRVERHKELIFEMEEQNEKLEKRRVKEIYESVRNC